MRAINALVVYYHSRSVKEGEILMLSFHSLNRIQLIAVAGILAMGGSAQAAVPPALGTSGYAQNFDVLGTGTALPNGWAVYSISGTHSDWTTSIPVSAVGGGTSQNITSALLDSAITASTKNAAPYNIAHAATPSDRVLATSPTGNAGDAIQLTLTNNTGAAINSLSISYDIDKFYDGNKQSSIDSTLPIGEELPGYQLFYSVNGGTWNNVSALNPVSSGGSGQPVIPVGTVNNNGVNGPVDYGVTSISGAVVSLGTSLAVGQSLAFRWVDDNAVNISADQIIGLNNVSVSAVPVPGALWLFGSALLGWVGASRKRRSLS